MPKLHVSTYVSSVMLTAAPIVGPNANWVSTDAPPRLTRTGILGTSLATKSTWRRTEPSASVRRLTAIAHVNASVFRMKSVIASSSLKL
jgi:hypothetical protein